jgi:Cobyrinic acid a,c-diamide synthase
MSSMVASTNPFYALNTRLTGHEFHYSRCIDVDEMASFVFQVEMGQGITKGFDGVLFRNCLAGYTHMHALGIRSGRKISSRPHEFIRAMQSRDTLS